MQSPTKEIYINVKDGKTKVMIGGAPITQSYAGQSIAWPDR